VLIGAAESDPIGFVDDLPNHTILDEVQRAPSLFPALKMAVDRRRVPGRFLLTSSANVMLLPKLSESLAGRIGIIQLHPLARGELTGKESHFLDALFAGSFKTQKFERLGKALAELVADGGYPAALARPNPRRRAAWYRDYVETLTQRDVRDLIRIRSLMFCRDPGVMR
jgi:predicted AAA+ superfamily ATPase